MPAPTSPPNSFRRCVTYHYFNTCRLHALSVLFEIAFVAINAVFVMLIPTPGSSDFTTLTLLVCSSQESCILILKTVADEIDKYAER